MQDYFERTGVNPEEEGQVGLVDWRGMHLNQLAQKIRAEVPPQFASVDAFLAAYKQVPYTQVKSVIDQLTFMREVATRPVRKLWEGPAIEWSRMRQINTISIDASNTFQVQGIENGTIIVNRGTDLATYDPQTGEVVRKFDIPMQRIPAVTPDNQMVSMVVNNSGGTHYQIIDLESGTVTALRHPYIDRFGSLSLTHDGYLISEGPGQGQQDQNTISIWDAKTQQLVKSIQKERILRVEELPSGMFMGACSLVDGYDYSLFTFSSKSPQIPLASRNLTEDPFRPVRPIVISSTELLILHIDPSTRPPRKTLQKYDLSTHTAQDFKVIDGGLDIKGLIPVNEKSFGLVIDMSPASDDMLAICDLQNGQVVRSMSSKYATLSFVTPHGEFIIPERGKDQEPHKILVYAQQ